MSEQDAKGSLICLVTYIVKHIGLGYRALQVSATIATSFYHQLLLKYISSVCYYCHISLVFAAIAISLLFLALSPATIALNLTHGMLNNRLGVLARISPVKVIRHLNTAWSCSQAVVSYQMLEHSSCDWRKDSFIRRQAWSRWWEYMIDTSYPLYSFPEPSSLSSLSVSLTSVQLYAPNCCSEFPNSFNSCQKCTLLPKCLFAIFRTSMI